MVHTPAAAAGSSAGRHGRRCSYRSFATETAADKFELFSPEAGLTHIEGCAMRNFADYRLISWLHTTKTLPTPPCSSLRHTDTCCSYTSDGFLVNDVTLQGGLLALRNGFYAWDAAAADLSAVSLLSPPPGAVPLIGHQALVIPPDAHLAAHVRADANMADDAEPTWGHDVVIATVCRLG